MTNSSTFSVGEWLPSDQAQLEKWMELLIVDVDPASKQLHPAIEEFKDLIENDAEIYMLIQQMFEQVPSKPPYNQTPNRKPQTRDYIHMLQLMNAIMTKAPEFLIIEGKPAGLIGFPINAIFDWPMGTAAGFAVFLNEKVNRQLKKILNEWGRFLESPDSVGVLTEKPNGWFGEFAQKAMPDFVAEFKCDPSKPHYGFTSWDDFFTREFRDGQRDIAAPDDNTIINNACESAPYKHATKVCKRDRFWIKAQSYSLTHMLDNDPLVDKFVGGTIYQAFLSALSYHRWHSPVNGTVVKTAVVDGTYYSEALLQGFLNPDGPDTSGPNNSQGYITAVATRALIFIQADNPDIGLMCFMAVGMSEVSTCEVTVYEGQQLKKGDQTGMFHFGGSTHCLIFRPEVNLEFDFRGQTPGLDSKNIPINSKLATVQ